jgi:hypothetical protein
MNSNKRIIRKINQLIDKFNLEKSERKRMEILERIDDLKDKYI